MDDPRMTFDRERCPVCNPVPIRPTRARLSVSIPAPLAQWTRALAKQRGVSLSRIIEEALIHDRHERAAS